MNEPAAGEENAARVQGIAWYRESDWQRVKAEFLDGDDLHDTYGEWRASIESFIEHLRRNDVAVESVVIDIDDFIKWCAVHEQPLDAEARAAYVEEMLDRRDGASDGKSQL